MSNKIAVYLDDKSDDTITPEYPFIGKSTNGSIVLFTKKGHGVLLHNSGISYSEGWLMENFHPFKGIITLEQGVERKDVI
jgi:hypothetical protein